MVSRHGLVQVVAPPGRQRLLALLAVTGLERHHAIEEARHDTVAEDRLHGRPADPQFAPPVQRGPVDAARGHLGLEDLAQRLGPAGQAGAPPLELRRIECRQLHHGQVHAAFVVEQFRPQRIREAAYRRLGAAVRRLQRDRAISERRSDLHDCSPVPRLHAAQRGHRVPYRAEISDLGRAPEILGCDAGDIVSRSTRSAAASTWAWSATSVGTAIAMPPACCTSLRAPSRPSMPRASKATRQPCLPNSTAVARPIPADAPVTTTILSCILLSPL